MAIRGKAQTQAQTGTHVRECSSAAQIATILDAVTDSVKWLELYAKFAVSIIPKYSKVETVGEFEDWTNEDLEAEIKRLHTEAGMQLVPVED